jgi:PAS domain-containing protein
MRDDILRTRGGSARSARDARRAKRCRDTAEDRGAPPEPTPHERRVALALLNEQLPAIVWTTDMSLRVTSAGGAGLRALDVAPGHVIGHGLFECFQSDTLRAPSVAAHRRALAGECASFDIEWTGAAYQAQVGPMRDGDGAIVGVIGVALDVSERRSARLPHRRGA